MNKDFVDGRTSYKEEILFCIGNTQFEDYASIYEIGYGYGRISIVELKVDSQSEQQFQKI